MPEFLHTLFASDFMPHGYCLFWTTPLVWLHVVSDVVIALAYYSIPIALIYFVRKREDLAFNWMFLMFGAFIFACGTTHLMEVWTLWIPSYWLEGAIKLGTAALSVATAVLLWPLLPQVLALPSPARLETANRELQKEIIEHRRAEEALQESIDRYRQLFENANDGIYIVSQDGYFMEANQKFAELTGIPREEILGKRTEIFLPGGGAQSLDRIKQIMQEGKLVPMSRPSLPLWVRKCLL